MSKKILIIDDDRMHCKVLKAILQGKDFAVSVAYDGNEGVEKTQLELPDLVILDINMRDMDGFQYLEVIRLIPEFKNLPVIMITGQKTRQDVIKGLQYGIKDYLIKPISHARVLATINKLLE